MDDDNEEEDDDNVDRSCCSTYWYARFANEATLIDLSMTAHRLAEKEAFLSRYSHADADALLSTDDETSNPNLTQSSARRSTTSQRGRLRFLILTKFRSLWMRILFLLFLFVTYSFLIVYLYDNIFVQPDFSSKLFDSTYACHDTPSCAARADPSIKSISNLTNKKRNFSKNAFFSALYTENYLAGALILGHSIRKYHPHHPMIMMHFDGRLDNQTTRCALEAIGWTLMSVKRIPSVPGVNKKFIDQFTKLALWNLTQYDSIVYFDCDTVVMDDLSHLHELVADPSRTGFEFAAATDNWFGTFIFKFNAGVLVLHPSSLVFAELMRTHIIPGNYDATMAEQEFLNQFFRLRNLQLPTTYNMNMALYHTKPDLWEKLRPDFKIVHFTVRKPFMPDGKRIRSYEGVYDLFDELYEDFQQNTNLAVIRSTCRIKI